jgi:hypothetical protein
MPQNLKISLRGLLCNKSNVYDKKIRCFLYQKFLFIGADVGEFIDCFDQFGAGGFEKGHNFDSAAGGALDVVY